MQTGSIHFSSYRARFLLSLGSVFVFSFFAQSAAAANAPQITSIDPTLIRYRSFGTYSITITGERFQPGIRVYLGLIRAQAVGFINARKITATFRRNALAPNLHRLSVWNPDGRSGTLWRAVRILPTADPVVLAAGDISTCANDNDEATARVLDGLSGTVLTLGDNVYDNGTTAEFASCYAPTWGRHRARTNPAPGNHDYNTSGASGYYSYFGSAARNPARGFYSFNVGLWHVVALNSNCADIGGCGPGSTQHTWLIQDLQNNPRTCTLAYFHHPPFSSGLHGNQAQTLPLWQTLSDRGVDLVLAGHDHTYERFAPMNRDGGMDTSGMSLFVVGTGGAPLYNFPIIHGASQIRQNTTHGVMKLTLHPRSFSWNFLPTAGSAWTDSGNRGCR